MASTIGEKEIKRDWPVEKGLTARTQKQTGRTTNLIPQGILGVKTTIPEREKAGIDI